jgi:hypothetical protein
MATRQMVARPRIRSMTASSVTSHSLLRMGCLAVLTVPPVPFPGTRTVYEKTLQSSRAAECCKRSCEDSRD